MQILYRGLGHHFCNSRASLVPLWVSLLLFSSPSGLFYTRLAAARGSQKAVFLSRRTLTKHAQACMAHPKQIAQKQGRRREGSQKHKNSIESAPRERQGTPLCVRGGPGNPRGSLASAKDPPEAVQWRPGGAQVLQNTHFSHFTA